jgi:uncharacterized protein YkwD
MLDKKIKKIRHKLYAALSGGLVLSQVLMGVTYYSGPGVNPETEDQLRSNIIIVTNKARAENVLGPLTESESLNNAAKLKLTDMFANNYWEHTSPSGVQPWDFMKQSGYTYQYAGENLARGYHDSGAIVDAWMNSKAHKDNLLNTKYTEIGVAVGSGKIEGKPVTLVVQMFGKPQTSTLAQNSATETATMGAIESARLNLFAPVSTSRIPYFMAWIILFALIIFDGIELRRLGLHKNKKHMFEFRSALLINTLAFIILFINLAAIA